MANIARNHTTMEDVLSDVAYQMMTMYMKSSDARPADEKAIRMAQTAIIQTLAMVGDFWTGVHGPQVKEIKIADVKFTDSEQ